MTQITLAINGRSYRVACDEGEEERVQELGRYVESQVMGLVDKVGQVGELQLLVMAALLIADELQQPSPQPDAQVGAGEQPEALVENGAALELIEGCAARLESIAARLERL